MSKTLKFTKKQYASKEVEQAGNLAIRIISNVVCDQVSKTGYGYKGGEDFVHKAVCDKSVWPLMQKEINDRLSGLGLKHLIREIQFDPSVITEATAHTARAEGMIKVYTKDLITTEP
jgi:hypothetical protein